MSEPIPFINLNKQFRELEQATRARMDTVLGHWQYIMGPVVAEMIAERYNDMLDALGVERVVQRRDRCSVFAQYTVFSHHRERLQAVFTKAGVLTAVHYPVPLNQQPAYQHLCCPECTPVASSLAHTVMSVPMSPDLTEADQQRIVDLLIQVN